MFIWFQEGRERTAATSEILEKKPVHAISESSSNKKGFHSEKLDYFSGTVFWADSGKGVEGAMVFYRIIQSMTVNKPFKSVKTGPSGRFRIKKVVGEEMVLFARASNGQSSRYIREMTTIDLSTCDGNHIEIQLSPQESVQLQVLDAKTKRPVQNAEATLSYTDRDDFPACSFRSNHLGFIQSVLFEDPFTLKIRAHTYRSRTLNFALEPGSHIRVEMEPAGILTGYVVDEREQPIEKADVICPMATSWRTPNETNTMGEFILEGLPIDQDVSLSVYKKGYAGMDKVVRLDSETKVLEMTVSLKRNQLTEKTIVGQVIDNEDQPVSGAEIFCDPVLARTDSDGFFSMTIPLALPWGQASAKVHKQGYRDGWLGVNLVITKDHYECRLERLGGLSGQVVDEQGVGIPYVTINHSCINESYLSDGNGRFHIQSVALSDRIRFKKTGYREEKKWNFKQRDDLLIVLKQENRVSGYVTAGNSFEPVQMFRIGFFGPDYTDKGWYQVNNSEGFFEVRDKGARSLFVSVDDYPVKRVSYNDESDFPLAIHFDEKGMALGGMVVDTLGQPIEGAQVSCSGYWDTFSKHPDAIDKHIVHMVHTFTHSDGTFKLKGFTRSTKQHLRIFHPEYIRRKIQYLQTLPEEELTNLEIELVRGATVYGRFDREVFPDARKVELYANGCIKPKSIKTRSSYEDPTRYWQSELKAGNYTIHLVGKENVNLVKKKVHLQAGEEQEVNFLKREYGDVLGVVLFNGQPRVGIVAVLIPGERSIFDSISTLMQSPPCDSSGKFHIKNVEPGSYEICFMLDPDKKNIFSDQPTPFREHIQVSKDGFEGVFSFTSGSIEGELTEALEEAGDRLVLLSNKFSGIGKEIAVTMRHPRSFIFSNLAEGVYHLKKKHIASYINLKSNIVISPSAPDIHLGTVDPTPGGTLVLSSSKEISGSVMFALSIWNQDEKVANFTVIQKFPFTFEDLPLGPVKGKLVSYGAFRCIPEQFEVLLDSERASEQHLELIPTTFGFLQLDDSLPMLKGVTMTDTQGLVTSLPFVNVDSLRQWSMTLDLPDVFFMQLGVFIKNVPAGIYSFNLLAMDESQTKVQLELVLGKRQTKTISKLNAP